MTMRTAGILAVGALVAGAAVVSADAKSQAVLNRARAATAKVKSLQADLSVVFDFGGTKQTGSGSLSVMRPNLGRLTLKGLGGMDREVVSTGKELFNILPANKVYTRMDSTRAEQMIPLPASPLEAFFHPQSIGAAGTSKLAAPARVNGTTYQVVAVVAKEAPHSRKLFVGPSGLVEGVELSDAAGSAVQRVSIWLKNVRLNAPLKADRFAYVPPSGFSEPKGPEDSLLAAGTAAPDFNLPQPGGLGQMSLENTLKDKKAVLVNFWFYG